MERIGIKKVGNVVGRGKSQGGNTYMPDGLCPTLVSGMSHGNVMPFICEAIPLGGGGNMNEISVLNPMNDGTCRTIKNQYHKNSIQNFESHGTFGATGVIETKLIENNIDPELRDWVWEVDGKFYLAQIRKLTPKETWRLMGFSDEDFAKAESVVSNTQLYKQSGNSIVKNCLTEIFKMML